MPISRLTEYLPPELVYVRKPLGEDTNAWGAWLEAIEHAAVPDDEDTLFWQLFFGDEETGDPVDFPEGAEAERIWRILAENGRAFELIDEGLRRGRLQLPEPPAYQDAGTEHAGFKLSRIHHARMIQAKRALAAGDLPAAAVDYSAVYRAGEMMCRGEGDFIFYLLGFDARADGMNGIRRIAQNKNVRPDVLEPLSHLLGDENPEEDGIITSHAVELAYGTLNELDSVPEGENLQSIVDELLSLYYEHEPVAWYVSDECDQKRSKTEGEIADVERRLRWRREKILFLLQGHPNPFDKIATVRLLGRYYLRLCLILRQAMAGNDEKLDVRMHLGLEEMEAWSMLLQPHVPCELLGEGPPMPLFGAKSVRDMMGENAWNEAFPPVPTAEEWAVARDRLLGVENPIGKLIVIHLANCRGQRLLLDHYQKRRETQALLAKRL